MDHECQHIEKIAEMHTDIKWIKDTLIKRNGTFAKHIEESDAFRQQVGRNTAWRHAYKFLIGFIFTALVWIIRVHIK